MNITGVYYVSGNFALGNGELEIFSGTQPFKHCGSFLPEKGTLILFPSSVPHSLGLYGGPNPRISVAFDIWFRPYLNGKFVTI